MLISRVSVISLSLLIILLLPNILETEIRFSNKSDDKELYLDFSGLDLDVVKADINSHIVYGDISDGSVGSDGNVADCLGPFEEEALEDIGPNLAVGDGVENSIICGFIKFSLSGIAGIISDAKMHLYVSQSIKDWGSPYLVDQDPHYYSGPTTNPGLGDCEVIHIDDYDILDANDFYASSIGNDPGVLIGSTETPNCAGVLSTKNTPVSIDITAAMQDDIDNGRTYTTFMIKLSSKTDGDSMIDAWFFWSSEVRTVFESDGGGLDHTPYIEFYGSKTSEPITSETLTSETITSEITETITSETTGQPRIVLEIDKNSLLQGSTFIMFGGVYDELGQPVAGATVSITITDPTGKTYSTYKTTDSGGFYQIEWTLDKHSSPGEWTVKATATKADFPTVSDTERIVVLESAGLKVTAHLDTSSYMPGAKVDVSGYVTLEGEKVPGAKVTVTFKDPRGQIVKTISTETEAFHLGAYDVTYTLSKTAALGTWTVHVRAEKDDHPPTSTTIRFPVGVIASITQTTTQIFPGEATGLTTSSDTMYRDQTEVVREVVRTTALATTMYTTMTTTTIGETTGLTTTTETTTHHETIKIKEVVQTTLVPELFISIKVPPSLKQGITQIVWIQGDAWVILAKEREPVLGRITISIKDSTKNLVKELTTQTGYNDIPGRYVSGYPIPQDAKEGEWTVTVRVETESYGKAETSATFIVEPPALCELLSSEEVKVGDPLNALVNTQLRLTLDEGVVGVRGSTEKNQIIVTLKVESIKKFDDETFEVKVKGTAQNMYAFPMQMYYLPTNYDGEQINSLWLLEKLPITSQRVEDLTNGIKNPLIREFDMTFRLKCFEGRTPYQTFKFVFQALPILKIVIIVIEKGIDALLHYLCPVCEKYWGMIKNVDWILAELFKIYNAVMDYYYKQVSSGQQVSFQDIVDYTLKWMDQEDIQNYIMDKLINLEYNKYDPLGGDWTEWVDKLETAKTAGKHLYFWYSTLISLIWEEVKLIYTLWTATDLYGEEVWDIQLRLKEME